MPYAHNVFINSIMIMLIWTFHPWISGSISLSNTVDISIVVSNNLRRGCTYRQLSFESQNVVSDWHGNNFIAEKAVIVCEFHWGVMVEKFIANERSNISVAQERLGKNGVGFPMRKLVLSEVGNTYVTCHMGVSSCGQCYRNVLSCLITFLHYR